MKKDPKFAVVGQLPPKGVANSHIFLKNLRDNPTTHPLYLYSSDWKDEPGIIQIAADPGLFHGQRPALRSNLAFLTGLRIAKAKGLDYFLYLESDCRVRHSEWDDDIWREFLGAEEGHVMGGTPVLFNPVSWSYTGAERVDEFIRNYQGLAPIAMTGNGHLAELHKSCVFVNGALGIFDVAWLLETFGPALDNTVKLAQEIQAWDYELGIRLWDQKDEDALDYVLPLETVYSGYGEVLTKEAQRIEWLRRGRVSAIHQVKSEWPGAGEGSAKATYTSDDMDIMIVSFHKDIPFLEYALRSIEKFATGFGETVVVVPVHETHLFEVLLARFKFKLIGIEEPREAAFNNHQAAICSADLYCNASLILHMDSDCIFTRPVMPEDYLSDEGFPELVYQPYETVTDRLHSQWQAVVERAIKFPVANDFMTRHPAVHWRWLYPMFRSHIERLQGVDDFRNWVLEQKNDFPQGFAEFPSLGAYAFKRWPNHYAWHNLKAPPDFGQSPLRPNKLLQGWNREGLDHPIRWKDKPDDVFISCRQRFDEILK